LAWRHALSALAEVNLKSGLKMVQNIEQLDVKLMSDIWNLARPIFDIEYNTGVTASSCRAGEPGRPGPRGARARDPSLPKT
jgi:hypothetical protein